MLILQSVSQSVSQSDSYSVARLAARMSWAEKGPVQPMTLALSGCQSVPAHDPGSVWLSECTSPWPWTCLAVRVQSSPSPWPCLAVRVYQPMTLALSGCQSVPAHDPGSVWLSECRLQTRPQSTELPLLCGRCTQLSQIGKLTPTRSIWLKQ